MSQLGPDASEEGRYQSVSGPYDCRQSSEQPVFVGVQMRTE